MFASDQFPGQVNNCATTALAAVDRPAARYPHRQHSAAELDIEGHVNHTRFGPKFFEDCRKMGNNVIFQSVGNHNPSRMGPPGAVLEAYMTPTADRRVSSRMVTSTFNFVAERALVSGGSAPSR